MKKLVKDIETREDITDRWNRLMYAANEVEYDKAVGAMSNTGELWTYIETNWLPLRSKFVKFEIDTCMHMGCTTTNR